MSENSVTSLDISQSIIKQKNEEIDSLRKDNTFLQKTIGKLQAAVQAGIDNDKRLRAALRRIADMDDNQLAPLNLRETRDAAAAALRVGQA